MRISLKLYFDLLERIYSSFDSLTAESLAELVKAYAYFRDVITILENCTEEVRMIFHFMLPELDRGAKRSARAKEAAARRKQLQAEEAARQNRPYGCHDISEGMTATQEKPEDTPVPHHKSNPIGQFTISAKSPPLCRGA